MKLSTSFPFLAILLLLCRCTTADQKPNIVFIFIDDMGWKDVGFMGATYYETPNIDKLANEGMIFTNAYANAANCAPTRACLLSGQYSPRHGLFTVAGSDRGKSEDRRIIPIKNTTEIGLDKITIAEGLQPPRANLYVSVSYKTQFQWVHRSVLNLFELV
ncbi:MAG: sulfatase-like hydrolase/transferase [Cyclobacteriaceae bacterium]